MKTFIIGLNSNNNFLRIKRNYSKAIMMILYVLVYNFEIDNWDSIKTSLYK